MAKWQVSIRDLLLSMTLVALSMALIPVFPALLYVGVFDRSVEVQLYIAVSLCVAFTGLLGAGIGALFRQPWIGALGGAIIGMLPGALYVVYGLLLRLAYGWAIGQFPF